jgi:hypothetical protein
MPSVSSNIQEICPWLRDLYQKLIIVQLVMKLPAFHGTRQLITLSTRDFHWAISRANWIQSIPNILLHKDPFQFCTHTVLDLSIGFFSSFLKNSIWIHYIFCSSPHVIPNNICWNVQIVSPHDAIFCNYSYLHHPSSVKIVPAAIPPLTSSIYVLFLWWEITLYTYKHKSTDEIINMYVLIFRIG